MKFFKLFLHFFFETMFPVLKIFKFKETDIKMLHGAINNG